MSTDLEYAIKRLEESCAASEGKSRNIYGEPCDGITTATPSLIRLLIADWRKRGEALEPFAKHAEMMDLEFADHGDDIIAAGIAEHPITFGDFRRALAALTPPQPPAA